MNLEVQPIVIIEDNIPIRKLFSTLVKKAGFIVQDFPDGEKAISWLKGNSAQLIIMDILLPDINGVDLLKEVRNIDINKSTPVVAVTGFANSEDELRFLEQGFTSYISKPIDTKLFIEHIQTILNN